MIIYLGKHFAQIFVFSPPSIHHRNICFSLSGTAAPSDPDRP